MLLTAMQEWSLDSHLKEGRKAVMAFFPSPKAKGFLYYCCRQLATLPSKMESEKSFPRRDHQA